MKSLFISKTMAAHVTGRLLRYSVISLLILLISPAYGEWPKTVIDDNLNGAICVRVVDLDKDGHLDIVAAAIASAQIVWYEGPGWNKNTIGTGLSGAFRLEVADINGDDTLDVVATGMRADAVVWYQGPDWNAEDIDAGLACGSLGRGDCQALRRGEGARYPLRRYAASGSAPCRVRRCQRICRGRHHHHGRL